MIVPPRFMQKSSIRVLHRIFFLSPFFFTAQPHRSSQEKAMSHVQPRMRSRVGPDEGSAPLLGWRPRYVPDSEQSHLQRCLPGSTLLWPEVIGGGEREKRHHKHVKVILRKMLSTTSSFVSCRVFITEAINVALTNALGAVRVSCRRTAQFVPISTTMELASRNVRKR